MTTSQQTGIPLSRLQYFQKPIEKSKKSNSKPKPEEPKTGHLNLAGNRTFEFSLDIDKVSRLGKTKLHHGQHAVAAGQQLGLVA